MIKIRRAHALDARQMAELLNEVIAIGGTTALIGAISREDILGWMSHAEGVSAWHVAEDGRDSAQRLSSEAIGLRGPEIVGFQWITRADYLPPEAAEIATFAKPGNQGLGIGSKLFEATRKAAQTLGYSWINANIRADNSSGLAYYQSRGFENYSGIEGYEMADGTRVDKILKRLDL